MFTTILDVETTHGTRAWFGSGVGMVARVQKPRPVVLTLGAIDIDNTTGVSAARRCRT